MPGGDGTGPLGQGPMTGRGAGACGGTEAPGYANAGLRRGFSRRGFGCGAGGMGWRRWFFAAGLPGWAQLAASSSEAESHALQGRAAMLQQQLDAIKKRLDALRSETER